MLLPSYGNRRHPATADDDDASRAPLIVARDRGQLVQVLQQDAAALQVQNTVLAPGLQLTVDAFARRADEDPELLLRDVHFRSVVGAERAKPAREADRQRLQHRFFHPLALPADALAQQHDDLDRDLRFAFEMAQEILSSQHEQFRRLARGRIRGAALAVEDRDLAEQVARPHEIQRQPAAVGSPGLDADLTAADAVQRVAGIALLKQNLAHGEVQGVTQIRDPLQL